MKCPKCGLMSNNKTCPNCGSSLDSQNETKIQKKNGFPTWAIVLLCVLGFIVFIGIFSDDETSYTNNTNNTEQTNTEEKEKQEETTNTKINIKSDKVQNIKIGEKKEIKYSVSPWSKRNSKVTWSSSDDKIVHVYENGEILGMSSGTATIIATVDDAKASITVNVAKLTYDKEGSLKEIANVYYSNEAKGNSNYFGKMVKVTGVVDRVKVDDSVIFNTGVTIWIKEKGAKYDLACNNENGIVGVTDISKGDKIAVVGKMNTMAGSSLLLDDCEIYK